MAARDARLESDWWHTAQMLSQFYNANRGQGKPPIDAAKFNPFTKAKPVSRQATQADLDELFGPAGG
tara:strand:+ start:351 stop:551 length:201 start_codon:yes stop_codon:yes gene_type:complete